MYYRTSTKSVSPGYEYKVEVFEENTDDGPSGFVKSLKGWKPTEDEAKRRANEIVDNKE